ncbi:hypothetical protein COCSUDRAFT_83464 [Coccomyxa subellipsoidea C-169]|uniref:Uncharacterized protein n=1 Tax=Coccomyxa subellipsoidea (strain C-169) TaxID=574566 RepID=I0ZB25_COCSC|nr:hypothetical protein COCSUDRAFT_83464 [Coccomyxa subellipsoidea C-169]EIE27844.1 hypothetical protein COCSUDRAFT_83464 [Coccomyxa subellipsoidea C-169]|eukprot:XP_005652388.1 hypothetical protein COCSUDRAFT_83464 [Coccomyxa subellipsoidea C-169]
MNIVYNGIVHTIFVCQGEEGRANFQEKVRKIFGLQDYEDIYLSFGCIVPGTGDEITLEGWESFDAAVHCAAICAGARKANASKETTSANQRSPLNFAFYPNSPMQLPASCPPSARERLMAIIRQKVRLIWRETWKSLRTGGPSLPEQSRGLHLDVRFRGGPQFATSRDELYNLM